MNRPALTTTGFLRDSRSMALAVKSCGRNQPACAMTARRPNASGASVSLLRKSGRIVDRGEEGRAEQEARPVAHVDHQVPAVVALDLRGQLFLGQVGEGAVELQQPHEVHAGAETGEPAARQLGGEEWLIGRRFYHLRATLD